VSLTAAATKQYDYQASTLTRDAHPPAGLSRIVPPVQRRMVEVRTPLKAMLALAPRRRSNAAR
jgi:hypothetical protein